MAYINGKEVLFDPYISINGAQTPTQAKTVDITKNGKTEVLPDTGYALSKVIVNTNVESKGAELNIAYGDTPPEDTTKLWVKTSEPSKVVVSDNFDVETIEGTSLVASTAAHTQDHSAGAGGTIDGKIYLIGGAYCPLTSNARLTTEIVCYDPDTEVFTTMPAVLPQALICMGCAVVGTKMYLFGGSKDNDGSSYFTNTIYCFDAASQTLTTLSATLPKKDYKLTAVAVGTNIYIMGGNTVSSVVYSFDTLTDTISTLSFSMPVPFKFGLSFSYGANIYLVGHYCNSAYSTDILQINIDKQTVNTFGKLSVTRVYGAALVGGKLCVYGEPTSAYKIDVVDLETKSIETFSITSLLGQNFAFYFAVAVSCNDAMYLFDGYQYNYAQSSSHSKNVHKFKASVDKLLLPQGVLQIKPTLGRNKFSLIKSDSLDVEIGVDVVAKGNANNEAELIETAIYKDNAWTNI